MLLNLIFDESVARLACTCLFIHYIVPSLWVWAIPYLLCYLVVSVGRSRSMRTRRKLMLSTWSAPSEGNVYGTIAVRAGPLLKLIEKSKAKLSITACVAKALAIAFRSGPSLNNVLVDNVFSERKGIDVSCLVALQGGKDLGNVKIPDADNQTLEGIMQRIHGSAKKLRSGKDKDFESSKPLLRMLPVWLLKPIVALVGYMSSALGWNVGPIGVRPYPFGVAIITSLGMMGIDNCYVPFTPFAHVPLMCAIGSTKKCAVVNDKGAIVAEDQFNLCMTLDHRYIDGMDASKIYKQLKVALEQPNEYLLEGESKQQ